MWTTKTWTETWKTKNNIFLKKIYGEKLWTTCFIYLIYIYKSNWNNFIIQIILFQFKSNWKLHRYSTKVINVILRLVHDVNFVAGLWCQCCRHIIMSGILFWLKLLHFSSNLSEPKKTLKALFPTLQGGELLIIEGRFVIIKTSIN